MAKKYENAAEAFYALFFALPFLIKNRKELANVVMPLEGPLWTDDTNMFDVEKG